AALLNERFISIKVDREERPDLDSVYMDAVHALIGSGGWPLSVFLTPDGRPFHGGTYFPKERRHGLPAFADVLRAVDEAWRERRAEVEIAAGKLVAAISATALPPVPAEPLARSQLAAAVAALEADFDPTHGGWGAAPKFPAATVIEFLLRRAADGDARAGAMARRTLDRMAAGGINDQLGGGFARYSTDAAWVVPHFEKMLSDNALLARIYLHAWALTGEAAHLATARATLDFVVRDLRLPDGTFAASLDADAAGEEGSTYTWTAGEVAAALGTAGLDADLALVVEAFGIPGTGAQDGRSVLVRAADATELAASRGLEPAHAAAVLERARNVLLAARALRPQPARDGKALAGWNGLAIAALADAGARLERSSDPALAAAGVEYLALAVAAADRLLTVLRGPDGRLRRSWAGGRAGHAAMLEDHAALAEGLLALYEASQDEGWFLAARELADEALARFADPEGGFFDSPVDGERLVTRPRSLQDAAVPSGGALFVTVLLRLEALTGADRYADAAERALARAGTLAARHPLGFGQWLVALDWVLEGADEVAIVGDPSDPAVGRLRAVLDRGYRSRQVVAVAPSPAASAVPLLAARFAIDGRPTAFVCRGFACRRPVTEPEALAALLA
ncbi:MAG: thioredoxin domain-containing protein, partial [Chloroflexi bacterium]|nr:thioredoxin domain-containing protein [Chloroflexota bacterium]